MSGSSRSSGSASRWWVRLARTVGSWYRVTEPPSRDQWVAVADRVTVDHDVLDRLLEFQPDLDDADVAHILDALRQWVRIRGREGKALVLPSRAVYTLQQLRGHEVTRSVGVGPDVQSQAGTTALAEEPGVVVRSLLYEPDDSETELATLQRTYRAAQSDEPSAGIPLLFHVDHDVGWPDACTFRPYCEREGCRNVTTRRQVCLHLPPPAGPNWGWLPSDGAF
jgi:hypothetical protein